MKQSQWLLIQKDLPTFIPHKCINFRLQRPFNALTLFQFDNTANTAEWTKIELLNLFSLIAFLSGYKLSRHMDRWKQPRNVLQGSRIAGRFPSVHMPGYYHTVPCLAWGWVSHTWAWACRATGVQYFHLHLARLGDGALAAEQGTTWMWIKVQC